MKVLLYTTIFTLLVLSTISYAQGWQQTAGTPEGAGVTDMIAEAVTARKLETTGHEIMKAIHPHPTMLEAIKDAVEDAYGEAVHL